MVAAGDSIYHVIVGPAHEGSHLFGELELPGVPLRLLAIALGVSAAVCYVLARYLASPVDRLRLATRQLAAGDLSVRVLPALKGRKDDLGLLAADLDAMAERLRVLLEAKQQLLRDVSHELRSPLARLQVALSLASREKSSVERHLGRIAREAQRLEQLIGRTLKLARLERPAQHIDPSPMDVGAMLRTIAADVAIEAEARGCLVQVLADAEHDAELAVSADPELLRSAFENVIRNAVRYSPTRATVVISARRRLRDDRPQEEMIEVIVRDHGPGVPDKDLGLIFEPFYRVDAARGHGGEGREGGEGLGLAIASRAIALHGGQIVARNAEGGGLSVLITLPRLRGAHSTGPAAEAAA